jgi:hypothetical protein
MLYDHLVAVTNIPLVDLSRAQITRMGPGTIVISDPESPLVITATVDAKRTPRRIVELIVSARTDQARITAAALSRLPVHQICHIATIGHMRANEVFLRCDVTPRPVGSRKWDDRHWQQVLDVYQWAKDTKRAGGGAQAIADIWGVSRNPTAYRWLARARNIALLRQLEPNNETLES